MLGKSKFASIKASGNRISRKEDIKLDKEWASKTHIEDVELIAAS